MNTIEHDILAGWSRLGILWGVPATQGTPDVEQLIIRSIALIEDNPRMLVLLSTWLSVFWRCVGRERLLQLALTQPPANQAILGLTLETADDWLPVPVFATCRKRLATATPPHPLFRAERNRPALARLAELEASDVSRRWGLWCLPVERKPEAIRPVDWVLKANPSLKTRALFKGALKTSVLSTLQATGDAKASPSMLARHCGVTRKAVYDALDDLRFAEVLPATRS